MDYRLSPFADIWQEGIFNVPASVVDRYLKMASEYQLKALLFILRNGGNAQTSALAKSLGITSSDVDELLEFWVEENVIINASSPQPEKKATPQPRLEVKREVKKAPVRQELSAPRLTPKDVVDLISQDERLALLLNEAQVVLGRTISHAEQEMLINMVNYYGLKVEIILMILEYYRAQKEKGKSIGVAYINAMAKNWSEEGIETVLQAEQKLESIEQGNRRWSEIVSITGISHRQPTVKQREMINEWFESFDITMISLASDIMKENIPEPKLQYMNTILKKWKKEGITSPAQVKAQQEQYQKQKENKKSQKLESKPSYDLEQIELDAMNNTEI